MPKILVSAVAKKEFYIDALKAVGAEVYDEYADDVDFDGLLLCGGSKKQSY